jgi:hypothetical protein
MPEICRFFGIVITMPPNDHVPPHFHASYGGSFASVAIDSGVLLRGSLPPRILGFIAEWASLHRKELRKNWKLVRAARPVRRIAPLE